MADWKALLHKTLLADGSIDAAETAALRAEILADGVVDREEVEFLTDLRNSARQSSPEFIAFFFDAVAQHLLADGKLDAEEAVLARRILFADGVIDDAERAFMKGLRAKAKAISTEFEALLREVGA